MSHRFWIVGGEYRDTSFRELVTGTQTLAGPYSHYEDALSQWKRLASATRADACSRYTIAQETAR